MPTPAEQKALTFASLVILLGAGVRVVSGGGLGAVEPTAAEQQALARQALAAESSAIRQGSRSKSSRSGQKAPRRRYAGAKFDSTGLLIEGTGVVSTNGFPPPSPRIDVDSRGNSALISPAQRSEGAAPDVSGASGPLDLDRATAAQIEALPGIGPSLAARIVASRDSLGPFGGLAALGRVKGVGPATLKRLARLVTFSGQARR